MIRIRENHFKISIFLTGLAAIVALIILLQTFFTVFNGNELSLGITSGICFMVSAAGIYFGKRLGVIQNSLNLVFISHFLIGILPLATLFLTHFSRYYFFPVEMDLGLVDILLASLTMLIPPCFIFGFVFSSLSINFLSYSQPNDIRKALYLFSAGTLAGSIIYILLSFSGFNAFNILKVILSINFLFALFIAFQFKTGFAYKIIAVFSIISAGVLFPIPLKNIATSYLYKHQDIVVEKDTPFGSLVVTHMIGQYSFFENGVALLTTNNLANTEENVHYAMLQHRNPKNVLLISGGFGALINEVLKYDITSLDYFEINPVFLETGKRLLPRIQNDPGITIFTKDPRLHLRRNEMKYDVVLINLPNPVNTHLNRYYTLEFFEELKERLAPDGVVSVNLTSTGIYLGEEAIAIHSAIYSTIKLLFANVILIPGLNNYFIASDRTISSDIAFLAGFRKITNTYVNATYLDDKVINQRRKSLERIISEEVIVNYDLMPLNHLLHLRKMTKDSVPVILITIIFLTGFLALFIFRNRATDIGLFISGFTVSVLQLILFIAFQIAFGYVYQMVAIFLAALVAGAISGFYVIPKKIKPSHLKFSVMQYLIGMLAVTTPLVIMAGENIHLNPVLFHSVFILFCFLSGFLISTHGLTGLNLYHLIKEDIQLNSLISGILGAGIGALGFALFLIPRFGLIKAGLMVGAINFVIGLFVLMKSRKPLF